MKHQVPALSRVPCEQTTGKPLADQDPVLKAAAERIEALTPRLHLFAIETYRNYVVGHNPESIGSAA
jgi:hypothetical protein